MNQTKELQKMLDKGGLVFVPSGEYIIEQPLIIHDHTHLQLAPDAVLRLPVDDVYALIENDGLREEHENRNIRIEGNTFLTHRVPLIYAISADGIIFRPSFSGAAGPSAPPGYTAPG